MLKSELLPFIFFTSIVLMPGCISPAPPEQGKETVKISVQPVYSLHLMSQKYRPLFNYLSSKTEYDIRIVSAMGYDNYPSTLEANQVHIGIQNPLAYITLVKTRGAYPLVKMVQPDGTTSYRGVIITRQGSGINQIKDLQGKEVAVASRESVGGFLAQALVCKQNGIDVDKDIHLSLMGSQDTVLYDVYQGKVDAGFVREDALLMVREQMDLNKINIIAYTDYFPTWCVAAFGNTSHEVAGDITRSLLILDPARPEEREILEAIGIAGFAEASDSDYDIMRKAMDALNDPY
jgi:phosphate/phosphite/phosphonate ABC transporter binding protein